jgi:hypothetical protein
MTAHIIATTHSDKRTSYDWSRKVSLLETPAGFEVVTEQWFFSRDGEKDCDITVNRFASITDAAVAYGEAA